jgi:hypothetical protein
VSDAVLSAGERSTINAVVEGIQRKTRKRRKAQRSGYAFLATACLSLPIIAGALDETITLTTAVMRIGLAFALSTFVAMTIGSMIDHYQTQAAFGSVEDALLAARSMAADDTPDSTDDDQPHS